MASAAHFFRLVDLVPPPRVPIGADGDWKRFTSVNGFPPPEDYRMLIREYGPGTFAGWVNLIEPFNPSYSFIEKAEAECRVLLRARDRAPHACPDWPIWPEPGGILPWATTTTGDHIGWRTIGRPDAWTTLVWGGGGNPSGEYDVGVVGFIVGLVEHGEGDRLFEPPTPVPPGRPRP